MDFRIRKTGSVTGNVRRIARAQFDASLALVLGDEERHEVVHEVRKRCKRLRALLRLAVLQDDRFRKSDRQLRDASRGLAELRDVQSLVECLERARAAWSPRSPDAPAEHGRGAYRARLPGVPSFATEQLDDAVASVRQALFRRRDQVSCEGRRLTEKLAAFAEQMHEGKARVARWRFQGRGFELLRPGMRTSYRAARQTMRQALRKPDLDQLHQWRKFVTYHWHHARLLAGVWPELMGLWEEAAHGLAANLGELHDLGLLQRWLSDPRVPAPQRPAAGAGAIVAELLDQRHRILFPTVRRQGNLLFAEPSGRFVKRIERYWRSWRGSQALPS